MAEIAMLLPFAIDPYGKVAVTSDQRKIWQDRVRSVIGTALTERVMRPTFGTEIPNAVYETVEDAESDIKAEVTKAFTSQLRLLKLREVVPTFDEYSGILDVEIVYELPNDEEIRTTISLVSLRGSLPPFEENL